MYAKHEACGQYHKVEQDDLSLFVECPAGKIQYIELLAKNNGNFDN